MTDHITLETTPSALDPAKKWVVGVAVFSQSLSQPPRLLMVKRAMHETSFAGQWEIPGGGVENTDRNIHETVNRELKEETGLNGKLVSKRFKDMAWVGKSGRTNIQLNYIVEVEKSDQEVVLCPEEHEDFMWGSLEEIEALPMTDEMRVVVRDAFSS